MEKPIENEWDEVNQQSDKSTIKRYSWKKLLGESLTQTILRLKKKGFDVNQAFEEIVSNENVLGYLKQNPLERRNMLKNIRISVSARYGETKTADKIMSEVEDA